VNKNNIFEQVCNFNYLGLQLGSNRNLDRHNNLQRLNYMCGTIKRELLHKTCQETILKFYKLLAVPSLLYGSADWSLS
jgi:hypothetical protein